MTMSHLERGEGRGSSAPRRDTSTALGLIVLTFLIHAVSPVTTSTDSAWNFHLAASILQEGDIDLDEYRGLMDLERDYRLRQIDGHVYSYFPIGTPLLVTPVVLMTNAVLPYSRGEDFFTYLATHTPDDRTARLEKLVAAAIVALTAALMFLVARREYGFWIAVASALVLVMATSMWSTASRALWQHGPSAALLLGALYIAVAHPGRTWSMITTGAILAFAYLVRPTNSLSFAFFGLYYLIQFRRRLWAYALGGVAVFLPYGISNWFTYGNVLPPYSYQLFERTGSPALIVEALVGTLVSPNRGIFIFSPILIFSLYGAYLILRSGTKSHASLAPYLVGILITHWVVISLYQDWTGVWSIGPRYFVDVLPYSVYLMLPALGQWDRWRPAVRAVFILAFGASAIIQLYCATSPLPFLWNGKPRALIDAPARIWDWGDLQFLRGLCPEDPQEGRAPAWVLNDR